jgi:hypothetical protein
MINKQTTLDLNGPNLSFIQQPQSVAVNSGSTATFIGIATASFPTQNPANSSTNTGTLSYRWHAEGLGPLSDGSFRGATLTGTASTTLTVSNTKSPDTNTSNFFLTVDYVPSAYSQPSGSPVTVGTARSTGNALNEILSSNSATLTVKPFITITTQPIETTVAIGNQATFSVDAILSDSSFGTLSYQWQLNGQNVDSQPSSPKILDLTINSVGTFDVRVIVSNPDAPQVISNTVKLNVVNPRSIIIFEAFTSQNVYERKVVNLDQVGNYTLTDTTFGPDTSIITFYAPEKPIDAELEIRAARGENRNSIVGGNGGTSRIRAQLETNQEHTVLGIPNNSGVFLYRGPNLISVVGKGGDAGSSGNGGAGGGVSDPGSNGFGTGAGIGGPRINAGQLTTSGIFGSNSSILTQNILAGDSKANAPNGGRTISCPKGSYWTQIGISPCGSNGITKFRNTDGVLISQSASIRRGFKPDYTINATGGILTGTGGNGGNGATGGSGGTAGGGGGGSGYTDGSVTTLESTIGGNNTNKSTINFKIYVEPIIPVVFLSATPSSIVRGNSSTLSWSSSNATVVSSNFGATTATGSTVVSPTSTTTYTITVVSPTGNLATATATITVAEPIIPTVSLSVSPSSIVRGNSATLTWNSTNATTVSSNFGTTAASGSIVVAPSSTTTYSITVVSSTGNSTTATATLTVTEPQIIPSVSLSASPSNINLGSTSILTWNSSNATSVVSSNFGTSALSGSQVVAPSSSTTYSITVRSSTGNQASAFAGVNVTQPPPPCSQGYYDYRYGGSATLCQPGAASRRGQWYEANDGNWYPVVPRTGDQMRAVQDIFVSTVNRPAHVFEVENAVIVYDNEGAQGLRNWILARIAYRSVPPRTKCEGFNYFGSNLPGTLIYCSSTPSGAGQPGFPGALLGPVYGTVRPLGVVI